MKSTKILVGIDGTGAVSNEKYDKDFANSFVTRLAWKGDPNFGYWRGPNITGIGLKVIVYKTLFFIEERARSLRGMTEVLLTGYSRGGTGVVVLAKMLETMGVNVRAMLLFDCVDMQLSLDAEIIPNNVRHVMHLVRSPDAGSRTSWGNDALNWNDAYTKGRIYAFKCTHGALGGVPAAPQEGETSGSLVKEAGGGTTNVTYQEDAIMSNVIWSTVQPFCVEHGFI